MPWIHLTAPNQKFQMPRVFPVGNRPGLSKREYLNPPMVWNLSPLTTKNRPRGWNLTRLEGLGMKITCFFSNFKVPPATGLIISPKKGGFERGCRIFSVWKSTYFWWIAEPSRIYMCNKKSHVVIPKIPNLYPSKTLACFPEYTSELGFLAFFSSVFFTPVVCLMQLSDPNHKSIAVSGSLNRW